MGVVLSGGGARGIAHLGALQALEDLGIRVSHLSGTSAGAIAATLYAAGNKPMEIMRIFKESSYFGLSHLLFNKGGIFDLEALKQLLEKHIPFRNLEDLPVPVFVAATDLCANRSVIFCSGPLVDAVLASACIPFIFEPVQFQGRQWVDGGILNNFPVEPLLQHCSCVIGSHVNRLDTETPPSQGKIHILDRSFHMAISASVYEKSSSCTVFLDPPGLSGIGLFDVKKADEIFEAGYDHCMLHHHELMSFIPLTSQKYIS
ncbi:MAG TPA: patatin-like phospholipase family protein [Puia sp.]|nr:patatin-like phospholipase family protein [Puia sp.]